MSSQQDVDPFQRDRFEDGASIFGVQHLTVADWPAIAEQEAGLAPDVRTHDAIIKAAHDSIDRCVRPFHEAQIVNAEQQLADLRAENASKRELIDALDAMTEAADAGGEVDHDEYLKADNAAVYLLSRTGERGARARRLAEELLDPLAARAALEQRIPQLRRKPFST